MRRLSGWVRLGVLAAGVGFGGVALAAESTRVDTDDAVTVTPSQAGTGKAGIMIDSRGGYAVFGTAILPLGDHATAAVTLGQGRGASAWWGRDPLAPYAALPRPPFHLR